MVKSNDGSGMIANNYKRIRDKDDKLKLKCEELKNKIRARSFTNCSQLLEPAQKSTSKVLKLDDEHVYFSEDVPLSEESPFLQSKKFLQGNVQ